MSKNHVKGSFWYAAEWVNITAGRSVNRGTVVTYHILKVGQWTRIVRYRYEAGLSLWNNRSTNYYITVY